MVKKKKKWFKVISPAVFGSKEVGEVLSSEPKNLIGRVLTVNARELTGDFKKSHINIGLIINELNDNTAKTEVKDYVVSRPYLQRFIHKGMSTVNIIDDLETNDDNKIRIKFMATINGKIQTTKKKLIRQKFKMELRKMLGNMKLDNIVFISTTNKIQKELSKRLKKIHPLRFVEIRKIELLSKVKAEKV